MRADRRAHAEPAFVAALAAARQGDSDAIAWIYRRFAPMVLGYVRAKGARNAEDITAEVFISVMEKLDSFEGDEPHFRSWLLTIAYHRRIDDFRRSRCRPEDPGLPPEVIELRPERADVGAVALCRLDADQVLAAIDELTDDQRDVLMLRVLADLPVSEIAALTGKAESAVKALLRRAFASMRRLVPPESGALGHDRVLSGVGK